MLMEGDVAMEAETAFSMDLSVGYEELGDAGGADEGVRSQCRCWGIVGMRDLVDAESLIQQA